MAVPNPGGLGRDAAIFLVCCAASVRGLHLVQPAVEAVEFDLEQRLQPQRWSPDIPLDWPRPGLAPDVQTGSAPYLSHDWQHPPSLVPDLGPPEEDLYWKGRQQGAQLGQPAPDDFLLQRAEFAQIDQRREPAPSTPLASLGPDLPPLTPLSSLGKDLPPPTPLAQVEPASLPPLQLPPQLPQQLPSLGAAPEQMRLAGAPPQLRPEQLLQELPQRPRYPVEAVPPTPPKYPYQVPAPPAAAFQPPPPPPADAPPPPPPLSMALPQGRRASMPVPSRDNAAAATREELGTLDCIQNNGGTCGVQQCLSWRGNQTCLGRGCFCAGGQCAGTDGVCRFEKNRLLGSRVKLRNVRWPSFYMYLSTYNNDLWVAEASSEKAEWELRSLPGNSGQNNNPTFLLTSVANAGWAVRVHQSQTCIKGTCKIYHHPISDHVTFPMQTGIQYLALGLSKAPNHTDAVMISSLLYPTEYLYVPHRSWQVQAHHNDPGLGGYWVFDPPLPDSIMANLRQYYGPECVGDCGFALAKSAPSLALLAGLLLLVRP